MLSLCSLGQEPGRGHASAGAPILAAVLMQPPPSELENQPPVAAALVPQHLELELVGGLLGRELGLHLCSSRSHPSELVSTVAIPVALI